MKTKRTISLLLITLLILMAAGCNADDTPHPEDALTNFIKALNDLDYESAGALLGDVTFYDYITEIEQDSSLSIYEKKDARLFTQTAFKNISVTVRSVEEAENDSYRIECTIIAFSTSDMNDYFAKALAEVISTEEYRSSDELNKYIILVESLDDIYSSMAKELIPVATDVTVRACRKPDGSFYILPTVQLMSALAGGEN